ncbi:hypothetical protein NQ314_006052 [Rhamnusium bicolor]|uniref:C3H1-type domain-containing protein n=1 Tax=Rhamnusium bicolor TaxID=1586634 RepID=A0AAV8Z9S4_9CUCU|nr:hypothetical protein NQ314_006052 [Rhamnusium bicolor]
MSDTSEETIQSDRPNDKEDHVCRDFIRGLCDRKFCKYKHENESRTLNFCHDYQNNVCPRPHCKFIHCTPEEVEEYKRTGEMSNQILAEATRKNQLPGTPPICNQFKKGLCRRTFCKYRHLTKEQEDTEIMELIQNNTQRKHPVVLNNNVNESQFVTLGSLNGVLRRNGVSFEDYTDSGLPLVKRRFLSTQEQEVLTCDLIEPNGTRPVFKGYFAGNPPSPMLSRVDARTLMLEEENNLLHKEVAQLKRQVCDLTATNEFLLDQNANLRVSGKRNGTVNVPAVTITNSNAPPQPQQVNRTVIASVATVPVSLATVSTCNPVSGNHSVSIAGCPAVSIASPAQLLAPSQQILVTTNPTTQLAIANSSQQLAIAQQNLANNLAQQAQPQLTSQAQQLALATTTQQLTSQAQHMANQQLALASAPQQLTSQTQQLALANNPQTHQQLNQQLANQQLTSQAQQLANQQLTSQAQQLALANTTQQLTSQAQQLALANTTQQLTSQAQQLAMANTPQQLAVANVPQQLALASTNQQLLAQQNLASSQQLEMHRNNQINAINTSQAIAMSNASQPMVSYPIMTQSINHALTH